MPLNTLEINCNGAFSNIFLITTIIFAICREIDVLMPGYTHMQVKKFAAFLGPVVSNSILTKDLLAPQIKMIST